MKKTIDKLDPIYTNATRKLALINKGIFEETFFELEIHKVNKRKVVVKKLTKIIGVYQNDIVGKKGTCFYCEIKAETNRDHFYPLSKGGKLMVHSCYECNHYKGDLIPSDWIDKAEKSHHYKRGKKDIIKSNVNKLIDRIINDGLSKPFLI